MPSLSFTFGKIKMPSAKGGLLGLYFICYGDPSTSPSEWLGHTFSELVSG